LGQGINTTSVRASSPDAVEEDEERGGGASEATSEDKKRGEEGMGMGRAFEEGSLEDTLITGEEGGESMKMKSFSWKSHVATINHVSSSLHITTKQITNV
jgi:hypothetical protein